MVLSTGTDLKLTTPLPVEVVMVTVAAFNITSLVLLNTTPVAVPVVMEPLRVVVPVVVTLKKPKAVVPPTTLRLTAPDPDVMVSPCVLAVVALMGMELKFTAPLPVEVVMVSLAPNTIPLAPAVKTTLVAVAVVILPLRVMAPVVVTVKEPTAVDPPTAPRVIVPEPDVMAKA